MQLTGSFPQGGPELYQNLVAALAEYNENHMDDTAGESRSRAKGLDDWLGSSLLPRQVSPRLSSPSLPLPNSLTIP